MWGVGGARDLNRRPRRARKPGGRRRKSKEGRGNRSLWRRKEGEGRSLRPEPQGGCRPRARGQGKGQGRLPPAPGRGPHSLVPLQEAALGDGPHGRPRGLGARTRGAETQAQLLLQAAGQRWKAVASPARPCPGLGARVTVLLVLEAPGRLLELIEILPVPVRRHRRPVQPRAPPRPAVGPRPRSPAPAEAPPRPSPLGLVLGRSTSRLSACLVISEVDGRSL